MASCVCRRVSSLKVKYGMAAEWGNRKTMEDRTTAISEVPHKVTPTVDC